MHYIIKSKNFLQSIQSGLIIFIIKAAINRTKLSIFKVLNQAQL